VDAGKVPARRNVVGDPVEEKSRSVVHGALAHEAVEVSAYPRLGHVEVERLYLMFNDSLVAVCVKAVT